MKYLRSRFAIAAAVLALVSPARSGAAVVARPQAPVQTPGQAASDPAAARRQTLLAKLEKSIAVLPSQHFSARGPEDSNDFYYLAGFNEPGAALVLAPGADKSVVLFNRAGKWPEGLGAGSSDARSATELRAYLARTAAQKKVFLPFTDLDRMSDWVGSPNPLASADTIANLEPLVWEMRIVKDASEIALLQQAIDITADAFVDVLKTVQPGDRELDANALIQYVYARREATVSFSQAASGPNSVNIHFGATTREMEPGDVIVFDLGAWFKRYTSDISRTIPVGGKFTSAQAEIAGLVLEAQKAAIGLMTPGTVIIRAQEEAENVLLAGLAKLGVLTDASSPWQRRLFIVHGYTHGIGLDIHDVWGWFSRRMRTMTFAPGMVLTIEPGLYFPPKLLDAPPPTRGGPSVPEEEWKAFVAKVGPAFNKYAGMGCRIEDDVLITETGNRVLSVRAPKKIADIERLLKLPRPKK
jgi:Xaa-Pro aminopeptidase